MSQASSWFPFLKNCLTYWKRFKHQSLLTQEKEAEGKAGYTQRTLGGKGRKVTHIKSMMYCFSIFMCIMNIVHEYYFKYFF